MSTVKLTDAFFHGQISLQKTNGGLSPWRLPYEQRLLFPSNDENLMRIANVSSGVRLRFETNSTSLTLKVVANKEAGLIFDLVIDNKIVEQAHVDAGKTDAVFHALPGKKTVAEIWFPSYTPVTAKALVVEKGKVCKPAADKRKRWVNYGSSISQCGGAYSGAQIWSSVASRALDVNLTNLGLGGQCHADPMYARLIRDLPVDFISLKLGINIYGQGSLNHRSFRPAIIGSVMTIREKHPTTPLLLISPVYSHQRETNPNAVQMTLELMRAEMQDAFKRIKKVTGDKNLYYMNGLKLADAKLGKDHMPDDLHPDGEGYLQMGRSFVRHLPPAIKKSLQ